MRFLDYVSINPKISLEKRGFTLLSKWEMLARVSVIRIKLNIKVLIPVLSLQTVIP